MTSEVRRSPRRRPARALIRAAAVTCALVSAGPWTDPARAQDPTGSPHLYVTNQGDATVTVVDISTQSVIRTVDLKSMGFSGNAKPHDVAVEPDGSHWYVSLIGENRILKFDREGKLVDRTSFEVPGLMALDPSEPTLWVGRSMSAVNPPKRVGRVTRAGLGVEEFDIFLQRPHAIAVHPASGRVYTASLATNQIAVVDPGRENVEVVRVEGPPHTIVDFAISPDGSTLATTTQRTGRVLFFDLQNPDRPTFTGAVEVGGQPWHPIFSPDGDRLYAPAKEDDAVAVVDVDGRRVVEVIRGAGLSQPHGTALSPDGRWLFVSNNNREGEYVPDEGASDDDPVGTLVVVDTRDGSIARVIPVGRYPTGVGAPTPR